MPEGQPSGPGDFGTAVLSPPDKLNRLAAMLRLDDSFRHDTERPFARFWLDQLDLPDFGFNPYTQFNSRLHQKSASAAAGLISQIAPPLLNEFRASGTGDSESLNTFRPEGVPQLALDTVQAGAQSYSIILPGGPSNYSYRNRGANWEALDNITWVKGRHVAKAGLGWLQRSTRAWIWLGSRNCNSTPWAILRQVNPRS